MHLFIGLMGSLLYLHSQKPKGQKMVIFLDDCDFLFEPKNINILKNLTATSESRDRMFQYTKAVNAKSLLRLNKMYYLTIYMKVLMDLQFPVMILYLL